MKEYHELLEYIINNGKIRENRTGIRTLGIFGYQTRFNLRHEFPAVTTKKLAWKSVVSELLWMLEGSSDERRLAEIHYGTDRVNLTDKETIWTANADKQAKSLGHINNKLVKELGPVYGHQWRSWDSNIGYVDQIKNLLENLKNDPYSRRHIVSSWNAGLIDVMALPPCHTLFQFYVDDNELSCQLYQRSADVSLGSPFNIASYSLLTHMIAQLLNFQVGDFVYTIGDAHIYENHIEQIKLQLRREPYPGPTLEMPQFSNLSELLETKPTDYKLVNYQCHDSIKMDMVA